MSSIIGVRGNAGQSSYAASKAGIIGFTKSIAQELGSRNVRVNAIAPGFIETDMTHYLKEEKLHKPFSQKFHSEDLDLPKRLGIQRCSWLLT